MRDRPLGEVAAALRVYGVFSLDDPDAVLRHGCFARPGQVRARNELRQRGIFVAPSGVRSIWLRNDLASFRQRLAALEKQAAGQASC